MKRKNSWNSKRTPEYVAYYNAKGRCENSSRKCFSDYGGRGIEFRFTSFAQFLAEVGLRPSPHHTLDRKDVNGHYEPGNVKWSTRTEQNLNMRLRRDNISGFRGVSPTESGKWRARLTIAGREKTLGVFSTPEEAYEAYKKEAKV